jgi:hypothetical protein
MGEDEAEYEGEKFTNESELQHGPVTNRRCTDLPCLFLFIVHIFAYWVLSFLYAGQDAANAANLYKPRDYRGDYCSLGTQESHEFMIYTLNLTRAMDSAAQSVLCDPGFTNIQAIAPSLTQEEYDAACPSSGSTSFDDVKASAQSTLDKYTTVDGVASLLNSAASNPLSSVAAWFNQVCVTQCNIEFVTSGGNVTVNGAREYVYTPDGDATWYSAWQKVLTDSSAVRSSFTLEALPQSSCPYDAKRCVPLPGVTFTELYDSVCTFEVDSSILTAITDSAASAYSSLASTSVASDISSGLGEAFATFLASWDVTILVAITSFVVGLVFLILLRFFIKPMVWLAVLLVFLLFLIGGFVLYVYHDACLDDTLADTSTLTGLTSEQQASCLDYKVASETGRQALLVCAYISWGLAALYALIIVCIFNRIRLAVNINAVAAQFVYNTPHIILVPVVQGISALLWTVIWLAMVTFLLSQVKDDYVDTTTSYTTWNEAYTNCVDTKWPEGGIYKKDDTGDWMCYLPRYAIDYRFWFSLFSFFWHHAFMVAVGQCTIAGAVGVWFFNKGERGSTSASMLSVCTGLKNCFRYHLGSLAFGSFILAVIQTVRWFMVYLSKQAQAQQNKIMEIVCKIFAYCLWCFEKSVKFLNKNAYIQVALLGTGFCTSAKNAFFLILRNAVRFGVLGTLGFVVHFIGKWLITAATALIGFLLLESLHGEEVSVPYVCIVVYCCIGYIMGILFMNVFGLAVDATLQCFIATEEMGIDASFIPPKLQRFVDDHHSSGDNDDKGGCCHGCCH